MSDLAAELGVSPGMSAGAVFDRLAASYDHDFTCSRIGRAQRNEVWKVLREIFRANDSVLELNCGTGEDAFFLAAHGISVLSCDASQQMILHAEERLRQEQEVLPVVFCQLPTERITELNPLTPFDGVFSNFSGLNCVADLAPLSAELARLTKPGSQLLLCFSTRYCLIEIVYYMLLTQPRKALRRCTGRAQASLHGAELTVYYPTLGKLRRSFAPHFQLRSVRGVGVAIPPSYLEPWVSRHPRLFELLCRIEARVAGWPILRTTGDHLLLHLERVTQ
jgi:ubiquinone/menaquinone biosynthesis C-methylase UbiE